MSTPAAGAARLAWGLAAVALLACAALAVALLDAHDQNAALEARLLVAERSAGAPPPPAAGRRARHGAGGPWRPGRARRGAGAGAGGEAGGDGGTGGTGGAAAEVAPTGEELRAARRADAGADTRATQALEALDVAIADLGLEPELADDVRAIYEESFAAGARIRAEVRAGERDEASARDAHQVVRGEAREALESLLEPDELIHIRRTVRRGGRGRL